MNGKEDYSGGRKVEKNPDTMCIINVFREFFFLFFFLQLFRDDNSENEKEKKVLPESKILIIIEILLERYFWFRIAEWTEIFLVEKSGFFLDTR